MAASFEVRPYCIESLREILEQKGRATPGVVEAKGQVAYFETYFGALSAKTIVVENEYIDRDFLEDYAAYYVRCFHDYPRKCARLHFFRVAFSSDDFSALLDGREGTLSGQALQEAYLGFVVVKPLPETLVGRTCLQTYPDEGVRHFPITRDYDANLFGIDLRVRTLAFQEQDQVAAACATSALWSVLNGTGILFQHAIPSPVEITRAASANASSQSRYLPSAGLTLDQMASAIRSVGLEPFVIGVHDEPSLKSAVYAYLRGRVPVLMALRLYDTSVGAYPKFLGLHAVAVTGFRIDPNQSPSAAPDSVHLTAMTIDRLYAHDDGVGPFSRMCVDGTPLPVPSLGGHLSMSISTSWGFPSHPLGSVRALPLNLLIPLYHKIRIPYAKVQEAVIAFDVVLEVLRSSGHSPVHKRPTWDIHLTTVNELKRSVLSSRSIAIDVRRSTLSLSFPRFMWRATAIAQHAPVLDLLFDATDIEQGRFLAHVIEYDSSLSELIRAVSSVDGFVASCGSGARMILNWFRGTGAAATGT